MANVTAVSAWQCPTGLTVDPFSRYSGCTVGIELAQFLGWWFLLLTPPYFSLCLFAAVKLHLHDPTSSPTRVHAIVLQSIAMAMCYPVLSSAAWDPHTPATSEHTTALSGGAGFLLFMMGGYKFAFNIMLAGIFQMAYSLDQSKAKAWTNRLNWVGLVGGFVHGAGALITWVGIHLAHDQKGTDLFVATGFASVAIAMLIVACTMAYGALELRGLQKVISAQSSSGKTLKKLLPIVTSMAILCGNSVVNLLLVPIVPWLRHRAGIIWILLWATFAPLFHLVLAYELQQLSKRKLAEKNQRQILPTSTDTHERAVQTSAIANTIAATQQALRSSKRSRRDPSSSLVLDSGVSLAFIEMFVRENSINETMTANDAVGLHVKSRTKEIGLDGSGAYVELIGDGIIDSGLRWCGTPTHMLSYSWSYSIATIVAGLQKFERENLPSKGECYYYFIVRVTLCSCSL
jgi:hypothetical protein